MRSYRQLKVLCATLVVWLAASIVAHAADNYIQGSPWSDPNNWSLHSPPANGDNAFITGSSPSGLAVLFDHNYTSPGLDGLTVDNTGGGNMVLSVPANSLIAATGYVGKTGQGTIRQTGGVMALSNWLSLGETAGSSGRYELSLGELTAGSMVVGNAGSGTFIQTDGSASFASDLVLGRLSGSSGRYELSGGTLAPDRVRLADGGTGTLVISGSGQLDINRSIEVGASDGQGTVEQTGGTVVTRFRSVTLGTENFACTGTWNLSGGTHTMLAEPLHVYNGSYNVSGTGQFTGTSVNLRSSGTDFEATVGNFNQSGGTTTIAEQLTIGSSDRAEKTPRYTLSNGTLTAAKALVGGQGAGLFQQTGGHAAITDLHVAANGRYECSGESLTIANTWDVGGQFDFLNGNATVTAGPEVTVNLSVGQILNATHATLNVLGADSLVVFASGFNPGTQFASFTNQGTTYYTGSTMTVAAGKTVKLVGDFNDHVVVHGTLTNRGQPVNLNNGVEVSGAGVVNLDGGTLTVQDTVSSISNGQLTAHSGCIGKTGNATFVQSGGVVTLSRLSLGETAGSSGRYELSLGQLAADAFLVGEAGSGTFIQTGGLASSASNLVLGRSSGSSGRYELSGGTLAPDGVRIADGGAGTLVISGSGQLDVNRSIEVGASDGQGTVEQTGGTVVTRLRSVTLGTENFACTGTWNLSGGTHTMLAEPLHVYNGSYNVSGTGQFTGTSVNLKSSSTDFESTVGNFNQSGGTTTIAEQLTIGSSDRAEKTPRYTLSNGTLTAVNVLVGGQGAGLFQQTGGHAAITDLHVAANGRYEYSGGSLSATKITNDGQFTFSGGGITAPTFINTGTATLSGTGVRTIAGSVTNAGAIAVHTAAAFDGVFTNTGTLDTDAVALTFHSLLFDSAGYVNSAAGAVYSVSADFINHSAATDLWDTAGADLQLGGGGSHLLALAGANLGVNGYSDNFAWRSLVLGLGDSMVLQDGNGTPGGALYVSRFIMSDGLSQIARIHGYGFDIYYESAQPDNAYLGGRTYDLTDGGQLIPSAVPEPATIWGLLTFLGGMAALGGRRRFSLLDRFRRWFLQTLVALVGTTPLIAGVLHAQSNESRGPLIAYVGTFTSPLRDMLPTQVDLPPGNGRGIHLYQVNRDTGAMTPAGVHESGTSPTFLALNTAGTRLYSTNETARVGKDKEGTLSASSIDRTDGHLTLLNTVGSGGAGPTYLNIHPSGRFMFVANYFGGSVAVLPILPDGRLGDATDIKNDAGKMGPAKATSAPPGSFAFSGHDRTHAHMIQADPSGRFVVHVDLGLDQIFVWKFDEQTGVLTPSESPVVSLPAGDGPRHFHFHPNGRWFYSIQEEGSTIVLFDYDAGAGRLAARQTISTLPPGFAGSNFCSEILVSVDGQFVYAGNRLHDSIGVFSVGPNGDLAFLEEEWTRGDYPRSFNFDPTGQFLYCCNQRGDNIAVFQVNRKTGGLTFTGHYTPVGNPSIIVFLDLAKVD